MNHVHTIPPKTPTQRSISRLPVQSRTIDTDPVRAHENGKKDLMQNDASSLDQQPLTKVTSQDSHENPPILLQSRDHSELLDIIDLLRSQGVSHYVPLPQLIVCGDQSSGKSSVLEAVSGVRFPTKDNLCTRFATELILRRGPETKVGVSITPGADRTEDERVELSTFRIPNARIDDFPTLVEKAKDAMGLNMNNKAFSSDVLRVEVTGPSQPHLTLVDLPGLIHAESKQQSASDVNLVSSLVQSYMAKSRSIILAVVSAKNDYANQIVTKLARDVDPKGVRTLGIITKPDTLHVGSESERAFVDLAKNDEVNFRLGWHVLRNRGYDSRDCSAEERDNEERSFFSQGIWTTLPTNVLGLDALKPRLSTVLRDQIISELPSLIHDIEHGIDECRNRLAKLGEARESLKDQRRYLMQVGQSFGSLLRAAVGGGYDDEFFGSAVSIEGYSKRLRAVVQSLLIDFADDMRRNGHDREIVEEEFNEEDSIEPNPGKIMREKYVEEVRIHMRKSRGRELPGTFNPLIVGDLFFQQARRWKSIVNDYCHRILEATKLCIDLALIHLTDDRTRVGLHREIIDPALEGLSRNLEQKISELIRPHQKGHPITYNHFFTETIQRAREEHRKQEMERGLNKFFKLRPGTTSIQPQVFNPADLLDALTKNTEKDMELYACSEATDCMEAYYKVAMKVAVDNVAVLGIEYSLLDRLGEMLSSDVVMSLDDTSVQEIAAEMEDSRIERAQALTKLQSLESGLHSLRRLGRHKIGVPDFDLFSGTEVEVIPIENTSETAPESSPSQEVGNPAAAFSFSPDIVPRSTETAEPLSPFNGGGSFRSDEWLKTLAKRSSGSKTKRTVVGSKVADM